MNNDRINAIRARCEAATPGEWYAKGDLILTTDSTHLVMKPYCDCQIHCQGNPTICLMPHDQDFIVHSREDLPWALDQIATLEVEKQREFDIATGYYNKWQKALTEIDRLTEAQRWIPVTERLPREDCIIYEANAGRVWFSYAEEVGAADWNITHWMPLPAAPEEGADCD